MIDATGNPQTILLLGGTSDIGVAIVKEYLGAHPARVILAVRKGADRTASVVSGLEALGAQVDVLYFDAADPASHPALIDTAWKIADVDVAIVAFGVLGDAESLWHDQMAAAHIAQVNYTGAVSMGVLLGQKMSAQGYGQIIAISSVAGEMVRRSNFVYGSTKAGMDGFYRLLGQALEASGVKVLVVRPGQVRSRMTAGMKSAPLTVLPADVARESVAAARDGKAMIRVPRLFGAIMFVFKHLPAPIMRKLPF